MFISSLDCNGLKIIGKLNKDKFVNNVLVTIPYTGGNGKSYLSKSIASIGVEGLSAALIQGTLANGEGVLEYKISGIPKSIGTASFVIIFGDQKCLINVVVEDVEDVDKIFVKPGQNIYDVEGNSYKTVTIGTQTWMAENLKVSKYNDGTDIPNLIDNVQWGSNISGAWCYYNNDTINNTKYGKLYNWYTVNTTTNGSKNVCPIGWHVPTNDEWDVLFNYIGDDGYTRCGGMMKEVDTVNWKSPNIGATNTTLFTGLPGGYREVYGFFKHFGDTGYWWSSSENITFKNYSMGHYLDYDSDAVNHIGMYMGSGFSIRCVKD